MRRLAVVIKHLENEKFYYDKSERAGVHYRNKFSTVKYLLYLYTRTQISPRFKMFQLKSNSIW